MSLICATKQHLTIRTIKLQLIIRYKAGEPGGEWNFEEVEIFLKMCSKILFYQVEIVRRRIRMMITPDWSIKRAMGIAKSFLGSNPHDKTTPPTENLLMRLAFHDCIPYKGGEISGGKGWLAIAFGNIGCCHEGGSADGCDGCLNWKGMDWERMQPDDASKRCQLCCIEKFEANIVV